MDILDIFKSDHASACGSPMPHAWTLHTDRSVMESEGGSVIAELWKFNDTVEKSLTMRNNPTKYPDVRNPHGPGMGGEFAALPRCLCRL